MSFLRRFLVGLDQLGNVIAGGDNPDETVSSAVGRKAQAGRYPFIVLEACINLFFALLGERDHCARSIEWDEV